MRETKFAGGYLLSSDHEKSANVGGATPQKVTVLGPGNMTLRTDKLPAGIDKRVEQQSVDDIPLKDRLEASEVKRSHGRAQPPSADSLTQLLVQSVASGDMKLLEEVLRVTKEKIVMATVRKMPLTVVLPFLKKVSCALRHYDVCVSNFDIRPLRIMFAQPTVKFKASNN